MAMVPIQRKAGSLVGTDGNRKGWLRTGVSDNEILFGRLDLARHGVRSVDTSPAVEKASVAAPALWL